MTPEYINEQWTEEQLALMFRARAKRIDRINAAMNKDFDGERTVRRSSNVRVVKAKRRD